MILGKKKRNHSNFYCSNDSLVVEAAGLEPTVSSTRNWRDTTFATPRICKLKVENGKLKVMDAGRKMHNAELKVCLLRLVMRSRSLFGDLRRVKPRNAMRFVTDIVLYHKVGRLSMVFGKVGWLSLCYGVRGKTCNWRARKKSNAPRLRRT